MRLIKLACLFCLGTGSVFSAAHRLGASLLAGYQPAYGGEYRSLNSPGGIYNLNASTTSVNGSDFKAPGGISGELLVRYILLERFFASIGGSYTYGTKTEGKYPLRNPGSDAIYKLNGTTEIPVEGSASLSAVSFPLTLGLVLTFWNEVKIYSGIGISYNSAKMTFNQKTADSALADFDIQMQISPRFIAWHGVIMGEYLIIGSAEDSSQIAVNAGIMAIRGQSGTATGALNTQVPTGLTPDFPLNARDAAKADISGYRFFFGVSFYFLKI